MVPAAAALLCAALAVTLGSASAAAPEATSAWPSFGLNDFNHRGAVFTKGLNPTIDSLFNVSTNSADVSCTPTILDGFVYFGDWAGYLYKADAFTGAVQWKVKVNDLIWPPGTPDGSQGVIVQTRTSPTHAPGGLIVIGTQSTLNVVRFGRYAFVMALRTSDGSLVWKTDVTDGNPWAVVTASPTVYGGAVYAGLSSLEEAASGVGAPCCKFRGNLRKLDLATGVQQWIFYTVPDNGGLYTGFAGNAVWGSQPAIDATRNIVYVATGNNYQVPADVSACITAATEPEDKAACTAVDGNWYDSVLAIDMTSGALLWARRADYYDIYTLSCKPKLGYIGFCPFPESPDYDFGQDPLYLPGVSCKSPGGPAVIKDLLLAPQKSGFVHAFDPNFPELGGDAPGRLLYSSYTGLGSSQGGSEWGSAYDGQGVIFLQNTNNDKVNVTLIKPAPGSPEFTTGGFATAMDVCTGDILWQAAAPNGAKLFAAPTYAVKGDDGYVFYPTMAGDGLIVVYKAKNGQVFTTFAAGPGSVASGPAIANNILYVGSGYKRFGIGGNGRGLGAFKLNN